MNLKNIVVRVPEDFHRLIKVKIAKEGITLQDHVVKLLKADLENEHK